MRAQPIPLVVALGLALAACSGDDDATTTIVDTTPTTVAVATTPHDPVASSVAGTAAPSDSGGGGLVSGAGWSVLGALAEIPADDSPTFEVMTADLAQVAELLGISAPDSPADTETVLDEWLLPLTFPGTPDYRELPVWVSMTEPLVPRHIDELGTVGEQAGWSVVDVDAFVHYLPAPPGYLLAVTGDFADDALAGLAEVAGTDGVVTTREGDDFASDITSISGFDSLGRAVRMARVDDTIAAGLATGAVVDWAAGVTPTLADDAELAAVAGALDAHRVLDAQLFRNDFSSSMELGVTATFDTIGIGWTVTDDDAVEVVLAYASDDPDALAEQLEAVFAEGVSIVTGRPVEENLDAGDREIVAGDGVVTVTYHPVERFWYTAVQTVYQADLPFASD